MRHQYNAYSPHASLALVGQTLRQWRIWEAIEQRVVIAQKTVKDSPLAKLKDAFITILAGGHGVVEVNTRLRSDRGLQRAFGRDRCAEQSCVSETLNRGDATTVQQLQTALRVSFQAHSSAYRHAYARGWQVLDVDLTGLPGGRLGEGVSKGYFAGRPNCRGRQVGRVLATLYDEIVTEALYPGRRQLGQSVQSLVEAAEQVLDLDAARRQRTVIRLDSGGGSDADVNWLLARGYRLLVKMKAGNRAAKLAQTVTTWQPDPKDTGRDVGWVPVPQAYGQPTRQVAVRVRKADGSYGYSVLVCRAPDAALAQLAGRPWRAAADPIWAVVYAYDRRGGAAETQFKGDKQGLGLTKRHKQRFSAQEILMELAQLAHNLLIWTRNRLAPSAPRLRRLGILRLVRDVCTVPGRLTFDGDGQLCRVVLNRDHPWATVFRGFAASDSRLSVILAQI